MSEISQKKKDYKTPITENIVSLVRGDVFEIGKHRLIYGDATNRDDIAKLMDGKLADMIFTDPPFNLASDRIGSIASNTDFINGGEFALCPNSTKNIVMLLSAECFY